jgi:hypothetical protein
MLLVRCERVILAPAGPVAVFNCRRQIEANRTMVPTPRCSRHTLRYDVDVKASAGPASTLG